MDSESAQQQEARVEHLWRILDTRGEGQLNAADLKKGLVKMDHRQQLPHRLEAVL